MPIRRARRRKKCVYAKKLAEARRLEGQAWLRAATDAAADAIITTDEKGTIQKTNRAVERLFGYGPTELIGQNVSVLMPSPDRERHDGYLERYARTGRATVIGRGREIRALRKDGSTFAAELAVNEFFMQGKRRYVGSIRDISGRRRAELQLAETESRLRTAIAYDLHDSVGQLLAGARLLGQSLARDMPEPLQARIQRIVALTGDALERVRRASRNLAAGDAPCDSLVGGLRALAERVEDLFGLHCSVYVGPNVAEPTSIDRNQAYLIAQEAVINAGRHSGGRHVAMRLEEHNEWYRLSIADDGKWIGEPLPASGLGIASMDYRSRFLGGTLQINGAPGKGTEIVLCWPCHPPDSGP